MSRYGTQPDRASFDAEVARRHAAGRDDLVTAFALGVHPKTVSTSRRRQGLRTLYGPGGRRVKAEVAS